MSRRLIGLLVRLYPRSLRDACAGDLATDLEHAWREEVNRRGVIGHAVAFMQALQDLVRARLTTRAERHYMRIRAGAPWHGPGRDWLGDVRYAARAYRRSPAFSAGLILTLALGIGANAAVFSLVKAVVLQPLPYERQHELFMAWRSIAAETEFWRGQTTPRFVLAWRQQAADVATIAAVEGYGTLDAQMDYVTPGGAERLNGAFATSNFFELLGVRPVAGRVFTQADEEAGRMDGVVLSHRFWARAFGGDASIVGRTIELTTGRGRRRVARPFTVLGVLPPRFHFTYPDHVEIWALQSWATIAAEPRDSIGYQVVGRLRPGVSFAEASSRFAALHDVIHPPAPGIPPGQKRLTRLEPIHESVVADSRRMMALLAAVAALLLVITCTTAGNALLIRVTERQRELATRAALGASRARLLRQLLIEGAMLAAVSAAAGVMLAMAVMPGLRALAPASVPRAAEIGVDASVLVFALAAAVVVTLIAAVVPAWRGARLDPAIRLKQGAGTASADRSTTVWRRALVGLQASMAAALLVSAALLVTSFWRLTHVPLGFSADDVITAEMRVLDPKLATPDGLRALQSDVLARVAGLPGVHRAAIASAVPFRGVDWRRDVDVDGQRSVGANVRHVSSEFFALMKIPVVRGRGFDETDRPGAPPVAIVSAGFARAAFGESDPIGRTIVAGAPATIVGVAGDVRYAGLARAATQAVYLPAAQEPSELLCLLVEADLNPAALAGELKRAVAEIAPTVPVMNVTTIGDIIYRSLEDRRFYTTATAMFAALALVLTVAGIVVIVARSIVERRRELAIRRALGATAARLQAGVVWQGILPVTVGCLAGLAVAFAAASTLASFLFDVHPREGWLYAAPAVIMIASAALTSFVVSRRATTIQPSLALRLE